MNNLNSSTNCSSGYVCGRATVLSAQFSHKAAAGFYTDVNTYTTDQYNYSCKAGSYCNRATPIFLATQAKCPAG